MMKQPLECPSCGGTIFTTQCTALVFHDWRGGVMKDEQVSMGGKAEEGTCQACSADLPIPLVQALLDGNTEWDDEAVEPDPIWRKIVVSMDGLGQYEAWTSGETWNGWATPHFEWAETRRLCADLRKMVARVDGWEAIAYYPNKQAYVGRDLYGESYNEYKRVNIVVNNRTIETYPIGAWAWCWYDLTKA